MLAKGRLGANGRTVNRRCDGANRSTVSKLTNYNVRICMNILAGDCRKLDLPLARHDMTPMYVKRIPISRICTITYVNHAILIIYS